MTKTKKILIFVLIIFAPLILIAIDGAWKIMSGQTARNAIPPYIHEILFFVPAYFFLYPAMPLFVFLSTKNKVIWIRIGLSIIIGLFMTAWCMFVLFLYFCFHGNCI